MGIKTFPELFEFYFGFVKPLYSEVQLTNELPVEVLFEINAAFDHISRHWTYGEVEAVSADKAYAHLKRSCLDIFKLRLKDAIDKFDELRGIDTSVIDNGEFDSKLMQLMARIRREAKEARQHEGNTKEDDVAILAFDLWSPVYADCVTLEREFYYHPKLDWAMKKQGKGKWRERLIGFGFGVLASLVAAGIWYLFAGGKK